MGKIYQKGRLAICPHCKEEQESKVEDYFDEDIEIDSPEAIAEDQCWSCDDFFVVIALDEDEFEIRVAPETIKAGTGDAENEEEDEF